MKENIFIIGNSAAAVSAVEEIRRHDKDCSINIVSDENYPAYWRCLISNYLAGDIKESALVMRGQDFYEKNQVNLILGKKVSKLDAKKRRIVLEDNERYDFDKALIATGARPQSLEIKGSKKKGVFGFRSISDAKQMLSEASLAKVAIVLGGGLIGLKAAYALKKRGLSVKLVVASGSILSQVLDQQAARIVQSHLERQGIEILTGKEAVEIIGNGQIKALKLSDGKICEASLIVVGKGVVSNKELVCESDSVKTCSGILVDQYLETSVEGIYAAGDAAEAFDIIKKAPAVNALWPIAVEQGRIAGANICSSKSVEYKGAVSMNSVEFFGLSFVSLGIKGDKDCEKLTKINKNENFYRSIVLKDNKIVGFTALADIANAGLFLRLIKEQVDISSIKDKLLEDSLSLLDVNEFFQEDEMYVRGKK